MVRDEGGIGHHPGDPFAFVRVVPIGMTIRWADGGLVLTSLELYSEVTAVRLTGWPGYRPEIQLQPARPRGPGPLRVVGIQGGGDLPVQRPVGGGWGGGPDGQWGYSLFDTPGGLQGPTCSIRIAGSPAPYPSAAYEAQLTHVATCTVHLDSSAPPSIRWERQER